MTRHVPTAGLVVMLASATWAAQVPVTPPRPPAGPIGAAAPGATEGSGLITGRVIDGTSSAPVAAVVVTLTGTGPSNNSVLTDAEGRFFFSNLPARAYTIATSKPGWMPGAYGRLRPDGPSESLDIGERDTKADITIRTWRYAVVSGRVTDEATDPVVSADVRIYKQVFTAGRRQFVYTDRAITDDRGLFRFPSLLPGEYIVVVPATVISEPPLLRPRESETYLRTMTGIGAAPILIDRADIATGTNRPVVTSLLNLPGAPSDTGAWTTYTSTMASSTSNVQTAQVITAVAGRERSGADVQLRYVRTYRVSGTLTDNESKPAALHAVHLLPADMADYPIFELATAVTDAAGAFTFFGVPQGSYLARVVRIPSVQGGRLSMCGGTGDISVICGSTFGPNGPLPLATESLLHGEQAVAVGDRDVSGLTIVMRTGARVSGRVEFEGQTAKPTYAQLARSTVSLEAAGGQTGRAAGRGYDTMQPGQLLPQDRFATPSTLPGRYVLRSSPPSGWTLKHAIYQGRDISQVAFNLSSDISDVVLTFTDKPSKIEGTVQDPDTLAGSGAIAILFPSDPAGWVDYGQTSRRVQSTPVTGGLFSMLAPPDGDYFIIAIADERAVNWQNPAFLQALAPSADRMTVTNSASQSPTLRVRRVP